MHRRLGAFALTLLIGAMPATAHAGGSVIRVVKAKKATPAEDEDTGQERSPDQGRSKATNTPEPPAPLPSVAAPPPPTAPRRDLLPTAETRARDLGVAPWVTLTGSLIVTVLGAYFTLKTFDAINEDTEIEVNAKPGMKVKLPDEFKDQQKRVLGNGIAATVLLSTGAAGTIASLVMLSAD